MRVPVRSRPIAAALLLAAGSASAETILFRNFTLIDGSGRAPVNAAAMIVEDGRITRVGTAAGLKAPAGAAIVNLTGKYVMPGMIDTHVHLGLVEELTLDRKFQTRANIEKQLATYASYGVTTVQSLGTDQDIVLQVRNAQRGTRPGMARVYSAGLGVVFTGGYGGLAGVTEKVATPADADAAVARETARKVDIVKFWLDDELGTMPKMPAEISKAVIDGAHRRGFRVTGHIFYLDDAKRVVDQGVDGLSHSVRDQPVDAALIASMKQHNTWQMAATLARENFMFTYASRSPFLDDPFFTQALDATALAELASPTRQRKLSAAPHAADLPGFLAMAQANLKRLADAGIPYAMGTDAGPPGRVPGFSEHLELELMVKAGLTPMQAITAATGSGAKFLRATDIGTLAPGKWADLIVLDADPLINIRHMRTISAVYVAGQKVPSIKR